MRYPKIRELIEAVKALVGGPYTHKFPYAPHEPAKRFRGKPVYSDEGCIACGACALVCPARAIECRDTVADGKGTRQMVLHLDECHYCGQCSALCTTREDDPAGIRHTVEFDLAGFDRAGMVSTTDDKELALCEICGDIVTAKAHLDWMARRLGPLAFSNPTLFVSFLKSLHFAEDLLRMAREDLTRSGRIRVLCSKCRRIATIERF
jgi:hydrogenase-4 component H